MKECNDQNSMECHAQRLQPMHGSNSKGKIIYAETGSMKERFSRVSRPKIAALEEEQKKKSRAGKRLVSSSPSEMIIALDRTELKARFPSTFSSITIELT